MEQDILGRALSPKEVLEFTKLHDGSVPWRSIGTGIERNERTNTEAVTPNLEKGGHSAMTAPRAFVSYSWDDDVHKVWVAALATDLRRDGIDTTLDQWHVVPGDQLPAFMEKEIRESNYVLIICTPNYRLKSDRRWGGVGYEGDIMTAEVLTEGDHRKFIPVLARDRWEDSAPSWLRGKFGVDLSSQDMYTKNYPDLTSTILGTRSVAPPLGKKSKPSAAKPVADLLPDKPLRIMGVIVDEVSEPKLDGTRGSALYTVPFRLNREPSSLWAEIFVHTWNRPPSFSMMHRPGIASVRGAKIILDGTTIEEVKKYHRGTLVLCVEETNRQESEILARRKRENDRRRQRSEEHRNEVEAIAREISFDPHLSD